MSKLYFFNTEKKAKEAFSPQGNEVKMYTCGPTVYNFAHIGNFRTYVFEDLLRRSIEYFGYKTNHVMNITDVDDKTIKGANEQKTTLKAYTEKYTREFLHDLKTLGILPAHHFPKATDHILDMIDMIKVLLDEGIAYQSKDGNIYFSIHKFPSYGRLSHLCLDHLKEGASERVHHDEYDRENASDFVLWKVYDEQRDGAIFWESPFGKGRPGWHIECSAMARKILGDTIDIHCGGVDNIFPHHENEIAQSECVTKKKFVRFWLHAEHLVVDGKKMSKSLGNFYTLRDLLEKGFSGREIRYTLLQTHYRNKLNFTLEGLEASKHALQRLRDFIDRLESIDEDHEYDLEMSLLRTKEDFEKAIADDLNIAQALAAIFDYVRFINGLIDLKRIGKQSAKKIIQLLKDFDRVLNIFPFESVHHEIPQEIQELLLKRNEARAAKDFQLADEFRDAIKDKGYIIEDSKEGSKLKKR